MRLLDTSPYKRGVIFPFYRWQLRYRELRKLSKFSQVIRCGAKWNCTLNQHVMLPFQSPVEIKSFQSFQKNRNGQHLDSYVEYFNFGSVSLRNNWVLFPNSSISSWTILSRNSIIKKQGIRVSLSVYIFILFFPQVYFYLEPELDI